MLNFYGVKNEKNKAFVETLISNPRPPYFVKGKVSDKSFSTYNNSFTEQLELVDVKSFEDVVK